MGKMFRDHPGNFPHKPVDFYELSAAEKKLIWHCLAGYPLSPGQHDFLTAMLAWVLRHGHFPTALDLAARLHIAPLTATRYVKALARKEMLEYLYSRPRTFHVPGVTYVPVPTSRCRVVVEKLAATEFFAGESCSGPS